MKAKLLEKCGKDAFDDFKALNYRSQVVAGSNYFVKVGIIMYLCLSHDMNGNDKMPCNKIDKPLVVYRFSNVR